MCDHSPNQKANQSYSYNTANQLTAMSGPFGSSTFSYNGLGDRLTQNGVNYTLDLNAGLTQVLSDGTNTYLYGLGRIAQANTTTEYFLGDTLGSVRQLVNNENEITLARTYEPYGNLAQANGTAQTDYGFTGEFTDASGLVYLRARYYQPDTGRFFQQDPWDGVSEIPATLNPYLYGFNNPTRYTDPSGENPLVALGALALWVGKGVAVGAAGGALIGCLSYNSAVSGQCGCELQQQALSMTRTEWIGMFALMGGIVGGAASLAVLTPATTIILGVGLVAFSVYDFAKVLDVVYKEGVGWTTCNIVRAALDGLGFIFGTGGIIAGVRAWRASGSLLRWGSSISAIRPGYSGPSKGWPNLNPKDLVSGYNGIRLQEAISNGSYRPPSTLIGGDPRLSGTAKFIYVIDENGTIWVTRNVGRLHHPDLVNGNNVFGAGEMYINQRGQIVRISDQSGHYLPQGSKFFGYLESILQRLGIKVLPDAIP